MAIEGGVSYKNRTAAMAISAGKACIMNILRCTVNPP
jgi:hypothetical protein